MQMDEDRPSRRNLVLTPLSQAQPVAEAVPPSQERRSPVLERVFLAAAHQCNNLLSSAIGGTEIALSRNADPALAIAKDSLLQAAELVRHVSSFFGAALEREEQLENVGALVDRTVSLCRVAFEPSACFRSAHAAEPLFVLVRRRDLEFALLSLLLSTWDFESPKARSLVDVRVDCARRAPLGLPRALHGYAWITVNGASVEPSVRASLRAFGGDAVREGDGVALYIPLARPYP